MTAPPECGLDDEALDYVLDEALSILAAMRAATTSDDERTYLAVGQEFLSCFVGRIAKPTPGETLGDAAARGQQLIMARIVARGLVLLPPLEGPR